MTTIPLDLTDSAKHFAYQWFKEHTEPPTADQLAMAAANTTDPQRFLESAATALVIYHPNADWSYAGGEWYGVNARTIDLMLEVGITLDDLITHEIQQLASQTQLPDDPLLLQRHRQDFEEGVTGQRRIIHPELP